MSEGKGRKDSKKRSWVIIIGRCYLIVVLLVSCCTIIKLLAFLVDNDLLQKPEKAQSMQIMSSRI